MNYPIVSRLPIVPGGSGGGGSVPSPAWPPAGALHLTPSISYTGTPSDVQSITFGNGLTMVAAGTGAAISIDANGLTFGNGKYLSYTPSGSLTYDAVGVFGRITTTVPATDSSFQMPINLLAGSASFLKFSRKKRIITSNIAAANIYSGRLSALTSNSQMVVGVHFDALDREFGGSYAVWMNGFIAGASDTATAITPTEWQLGKSFTGTIHEGVVFTRYQGITDPLYPAGGNSEWVVNNLLTG